MASFVSLKLGQCEHPGSNPTQATLLFSSIIHVDSRVMLALIAIVVVTVSDLVSTLNIAHQSFNVQH